jgi:hypothetical protein
VGLGGTSGVDGEAVLTLSRSDVPTRNIEFFPSAGGDSQVIQFNGFFGKPSASFVGASGYTFDNGLSIGGVSIIPQISGQTLMNLGAFFDGAVGVSAAVKASSSANSAVPYATTGIAVGINGAEYANLSTYGAIFTNASSVSGTGISYGLYVTGTKNYLSGNVGIGITNPANALSVAGTIDAKEVVVQAAPADYVFDSGYRLKPLDEVATYVAANHHLPDVPSAADMKQNGVGIAEMQGKLLAKIEELTLHMIEEKKRSDRLEERNRVLEGRIGSLEKPRGQIGETK